MDSEGNIETEAVKEGEQGWKTEKLMERWTRQRWTARL